ncbi:MAG: PilZ domain-containing protein [Erythrobacter sp.]|nr:MAG: PilZ domain-containing protein [Erythrobacter sp.]
MRLFGREKTIPAPERRGAPRVRVDCLATLVMPSGNVAGRLFDISDVGARLSMENPPGMGCGAILEWPWGEAFCHITWVKPGMCGVTFDRPLLARVLNETIESAPAGPRLVHSGQRESTQGTASPGSADIPPRLFC